VEQKMVVEVSVWAIRLWLAAARDRKNICVSGRSSTDIFFSLHLMAKLISLTAESRVNGREGSMTSRLRPGGSGKFSS
jgi:hypothetical protein